MSALVLWDSAHQCISAATQNTGISFSSTLSFSAWWYVGAYILLGFGETILFAATAEYVYSIVPSRLVSTAIGVWQMALGIEPGVVHGAVSLVTKK